MAKTKQQKQDTINSLTEGLKNAKAVVFANFQGLSVEESQDLRSTCREQSIDVLAAKKTLVKKACDDLKLEGVDPTNFQGGIATFMATGEETSAARIVNTFAKNHTMVEIFGGILEGRYISSDEVKYLASLPSREELLAKLVGSINAPVSGFVNALAGNLRNLLGVLNNIKEAKA